MKLTPWLVLLSLILVSCSGSKSAQKVNEETPQIELSDADEFIETPTSEDSGVADTAIDYQDPDMVSDPAVTDPTVADSMVTDPVVTDSEPVVEDANTTSPVVSNEGGSMKQYIVQKNETLMLIAFKIYGDYERWKELANQNQTILNGSSNIKEGMTLSYMAPAEEFVWNPQGLPYLIRTGDTLGGISQQVYTTPKKWKLIWENNRPLIKDPNKIFAGFTIHYLENGREVANEL
jgi:nucleoid-associated protein YgaU